MNNRELISAADIQVYSFQVYSQHSIYITLWCSSLRRLRLHNIVPSRSLLISITCGFAWIDPRDFNRQSRRSLSPTVSLVHLQRHGITGRSSTYVQTVQTSMQNAVARSVSEETGARSVCRQSIRQSGVRRACRSAQNCRVAVYVA